MNANNNPVRKSIIMMVSFIVAFVSLVTMACDEPDINKCNVNTCGNGQPSVSEIVVEQVKEVTQYEQKSLFDR